MGSPFLMGNNQFFEGVFPRDEGMGYRVLFLFWGPFRNGREGGRCKKIKKRQGGGGERLDIEGENG